MTTALKSSWETRLQVRSTTFSRNSKGNHNYLKTAIRPTLYLEAVVLQGAIGRVCGYSAKMRDLSNSLQTRVVDTASVASEGKMENTCVSELLFYSYEETLWLRQLLPKNTPCNWGLVYRSRGLVHYHPGRGMGTGMAEEQCLKAASLYTGWGRNSGLGMGFQTLKAPPQ